MHAGNWGIFGFMPGSGQLFSFAPSAQWPAGSDVEYLFVAGYAPTHRELFRRSMNAVNRSVSTNCTDYDKLLIFAISL